ncbi:ABC transporter substrate-binding protein [Acrocarpospora catenulata]|uniref:ABC transporter substrate-binding protein n=1 Tax=Acrocarpospora catenulata TaxID=2836182 RepID=UPI001BDA4F30|nr:ABC transporter substrate-binding protein [Acrocarpospora catenulata]
MFRQSTARRGRLAVIGAALSAVMILTSCGSSGGDTAEGAPSAQGQGQVYKVGFPALLSGAAAFAGKPIAQGAEVAVEEINETGFLGQGSTVELKIEDIKSDPAKAIALYRQYATDGAVGVLCCGLSNEAGALAPVIRQSKVPAIVTSAILDGLASPPSLFRPVVLPSSPGGVYDKFVDSMAKAEGYKTAVVVVNGDVDAMVADGKVWAAAMERNGVKVLQTVAVGSADRDFTAPATQIEALAPDVVVASTLGTPTALLARSLRDRGYDKRILSSYGASGPALFDAGGSGLAGLAFATPFAADHPVNDTARKFTERYTAKFNAAPDMFAAQGYTAMWLLALGMKNAGASPTPESVGQGLSQVTTQESVYGNLRYEGGQAILDSPGVYLEWTKDGKFSELSNGS